MDVQQAARTLCELGDIQLVQQDKTRHEHLRVQGTLNTLGAHNMDKQLGLSVVNRWDRLWSLVACKQDTLWLDFLHSRKAPTHLAVVDLEAPLQ